MTDFMYYYANKKTYAALKLQKNSQTIIPFAGISFINEALTRRGLFTITDYYPGTSPHNMA